jgi:type VI secretion system secreted protein VgrG
MSSQHTFDKRFEFRSAAFGADKFLVIDMEGFESISAPFRFTLTLVSADASVDFDAILKSPATFVIHGPNGRIRTPYHGVLAEFDQLHRADGLVFYRAVLVPRLWNLSRYRISEVYLNDAPIISTLESVLKSARLSSSDVEFRLTATYRPRTFVCQYQETHLDFLSRWMESEGLYYYFDHAGGVDKLVVLDSVSMHDAQALPIHYRADDELDTGVSGDAVRGFVARQRPLPRAVRLQEYNYRKAALTLDVSAPVCDDGMGDVVLYGENFRDQAEGERYAKLRAEEILCGGKTFTADATAVGLRSGGFAQLSDHYRDDFNGRYLITEIHHHGSQAGALLSGMGSAYASGKRRTETAYRNSFRAIRADVQFRAERVTRKPRIAGTMNATIDSEGSGQYAELDEYGQYKVQLPFDLSDKRANKASARVRMATPYSGSDHGMHFPLHKGAEVLLSFIDGDPDRPVIVGAVANSENRNVVTQGNAHENRIKTAGGNQIYMGDKKGKEVMWLHSPAHNTAIGIGETGSKDGGFLSYTSGSSQLITVGVANAIFGGVKNTVNLSVENSYSASSTSNYFLGAKLDFSAASKVNLSWGRDLTISNAESTNLGVSQNTRMADKVVISAGAGPELNARIDVLKKRVGRMGVANAVAGLKDGGLSAAVVAGFKKRKEALTNPWSYGPACGTFLSEGAAAAISHVFLTSGAKKINKLAGKENAYASKVVVEKSGIDMTVKSMETYCTGRAQIQAKNITLSTEWDAPHENMKAIMEVAPSEVSIKAGSEVMRSVIIASRTEMTLSVNNKDSDITLRHPTCSASLSNEGLEMTSEANIAAKGGRGVSLQAGDSSVALTPEKATMACGETSAALDAMQLTLKAAEAEVNISAQGVAVKGLMIKLG